MHKAGKLGGVGKAYRPLTALEMGLARTKKELAEVKMGAGHPKESSRELCQGVAARYAMIQELRLEYQIQPLCRAMNVSASGCYA